jgi:3-phosphoshikimate 1-carboxyvinyltransferase
MNSSDYSRLEEKSWLAPTAVEPISGTIQLPGSKSLTNRELVLSALASTPSTLIAPLDSRDSQLMIQALRNLGTQITRDERGNLSIVPAATDTKVQAVIDCGLAGTVMRFVPPLAATFSGEISFDGDEAARKRPMQTTIDSLRKLGVNVIGEGLPFTIQALGKVEGGELEIDASASSQFVSGLLLAAPRFSKGLKLKHSGKDLPSEPHIEMTLACLRARRVKAYATSPTSWVVEPGAISGAEVIIEPDLSNAGPFLAAALVTKGKVVIKNWPLETTQVGKNLIGILQQMGAKIGFADGDLTCLGGDSIRGIDIDMHDSGELAPTIVALAALAESESTITGISHLRGHETDRINALVTEINNLGGKATELADGIKITPTVMHGGSWDSYGDHRMATAAAIIGLKVPDITVNDINVVSKTMPEFVSLWGQLL